MTGGLRLETDGTVGFDQFSVAGAHADLRVNGTASPSEAGIDAVLAIPNLSHADNRLTGRGEILARLTGTLEHPDATARIAIMDATALGRPVPRLTIDAKARDILGNVDADLTLDGEVNRKAARGGLRVMRPQAGGTSIQNIEVAIGSVSLHGGVALDAQGLAAGHLTIDADNLDDISAVVLQKLSGDLNAQISLSATDGGQGANVKAHGQKIAGYGATINDLDADISLSDLYRRPVIGGTVAIDQAKFGGQDLSRIRLNAQGTPQASDISLNASARGFGLDARARVLPGDRTRIELQKFTANRGAQTIVLAGPATLTIMDGGVDVANLALSLGTGRLSIVGRAGTDLDLRMEARSVSLSSAGIFIPDLGLAGTLDGAVRLLGPAAAPSGTYQVRVTGLANRQIREAGLLPIDIAASGTLTGVRATIDAAIALAGDGSLKIGGSVPLGQGALDLAIRGALDAGLANRDSRGTRAPCDGPHRG